MEVENALKRYYMKRDTTVRQFLMRIINVMGEPAAAEGNTHSMKIHHMQLYMQIFMEGRKLPGMNLMAF